MLDAAASNGQPIAMVQKGGVLVSDPETFEEGIRMIGSALLTKDASAVATVSTLYARQFAERPTTEAWVLAACKLGLDCLLPIEGCELVPCGHESAQEVLLRELGDGGFYIADQEAERIYEAIASGDIPSLDIAGEFR